MKIKQFVLKMNYYYCYDTRCTICGINYSYYSVFLVEYLHTYTKRLCYSIIFKLLSLAMNK